MSTRRRAWCLWLVGIASQRYDGERNIYEVERQGEQKTTENAHLATNPPAIQLKRMNEMRDIRNRCITKHLGLINDVHGRWRLGASVGTLPWESYSSPCPRRAPHSNGRFHVVLNELNNHG